MAWLDKALKEAANSKANYVSETGNSIGRDWIKDSQRDISFVRVGGKSSDIAPVRSDITNRMTVGAPTYFQKGSDSVAKRILGSTVDVLENLSTGGLGIGENFFDTAAFAAPLVQYGQFLQDGMYSLKQLEEQEKKREEAKKANAELIQQDLIDEEKISKAIITNPLNDRLGIDAEADSVFGEKMDANVQSLGALIARMGVGKLGINGDLLMGMTSFGAEAENAFKNGATYEEAGISGAVSAAGEVLSEKLSGGIKFGNKAMDEVLSSQIARKIPNKILRTAAKLGLDVAGEGAEEIVSGVIGALGQKLSYADDKELKELFTKEDAWDAFVGGALMGGVVGVTNAARTSKKGDYASGLSNNERKVVEKVYKDQINDKMTESQKQKVWDSALRDMETGAISIETIEEVLGGKAYDTYKSSRDDTVYKEIVEEYNTLNAAENLTAEQMSRLNELAPKAKTISEMQKKDLETLRNQVKDSVKGDRLVESYLERSRRGEAFQADVSQYDERQRTIVQKAMDSGVLNNTNRSHQFVDLIAKISADKGVDFDFTNNDKIKESGFAIEGKSVNGYVTENGVTINMQSAKALNTVVGHEITHVLEGTEFYDTLQKAVFNHAESKGELNSRWNDIKRLYKDADNTKINQELAADLVGDYLFTDSDFINNLYAGDRNIFEKIYDEVKYLCKVVTAGSKEARELEKVKKAFADAYRVQQQKASAAESGVSVTDEQNDKGLDREHEVQYSLSNDSKYMESAIERNNASMVIDRQLMEEAKAIRENIAKMMTSIKESGLVGLPEDLEGNTYIANSSYDGTEENTTICPRSLASEAFVDAVSEYLGRPLTVEEQIYISQDLQGRSLTPECTYCYVATDRKAYRAFLGEYVSQRDSVIKKLKENPNADVSPRGDLYKEFLNGRKDTKPMYNRFKMWVDAYKNGKPMIQASHLANINKLMGDINSEFGAELKPQIVDAMKYAQSASWAKKRINYVAYNGHILKWKQDRINKLNSHYGLRMYSFSDFHPAFVLENMQMITDASVRGLKMLGYTKDTDFVDIFAPSGMNINVSTFGFESGGNVFENNIIGAEWEKAKALREQYPNVGITFVATNDQLVNWALEQDWIDVVIPYHLVRTGAEVAKAFNYTNYTSESSDTKTKDWTKGDKKYIAPTEHNNDKVTYLAALEKNHLKPRFERFIDNPNYMKLVNECRQSASESKPVQPVFNEEAAMAALAKLSANGYYQPVGGSVDRMYEIAAEVAENMTSAIAPVKHSLSDDIAPVNQYGTYNVTSDEVLYKPRTAAEILREPVSEPSEAMTPAEKAQKHFSDTEVLLDKMPEEFKEKHGSKWTAIKQATDRAHEFVVHGAEGVKPLKEIFDAVSKDGLVEELDLYMHHQLNVDRMSLEQRFGLKNKPVFGEDVTADMSRQEIKKLEKEYPQFKELTKDIYAYNDFLRDLLVECGAITQETANLWAERYPHYVPIRREGFNDSSITDLLSFVIDNIDQTPNADSMDEFFGKVDEAAPLKAATGGSRKINPLFETMTERAFQTYWTVAMRATDSGGIAPVAKKGEPTFENAEELNAYIQENYNFNKLSQTEQHAVQMVSRREEYKAIKADLEARIAEEGDKAKGTGDLTEFNKLVHDLDEINEALRDLSGFKLPPPNKKPLKDLSYLDPTRRKRTADIAPLPETSMQETAASEAEPALPERVTFVDEENAYIDLPDANSLDVDKVLNKGKNLWNMFQEYFLDNGMVFERLAKDTKDRGLEADWNFIRKAPAIAQNLIGRGNQEKGVKALKVIFKSVEELGLTKAEKETVLKDFSAYLGHKRNMDGMTMRLRYGVAANKPFMGRDVTAAESSKEILRLEKAHPEFMALADDVYAYNNHQFDLMVEHGMLSQEDADLIKELYPHYVPMNRFSGKNDSLFQAMAKSTLYIQRAIALNDFGIHLKNTLNSVVGEETVNIDTLIDEMDKGANLFELNEHGGGYTFKVYENGQAVTFKISDEMYEALKPTSALLSFSMPGLSHVSNLRRNLITAYSPWFTAKNAIRDVQEIIVNSQHARETYTTIPTAIREMVHKGKWYQEYIQNGGEPDTFFDTDKETFDIGKGAQGFAENKTPLKYILKANNFVEMVPRFAEYIASREAGRDVRTSMLDASRVTTNFAAGGKATKLLDRNGATFLNASVQGAVQHARNIHEANANGFKGWASLVARYASLGIPAAILNGMIWDDDEEYQQLPDYITENYYIVWKYGDGKFVRLPKGRTAAVVQNAVDQVAKESSGNDEADWKKFWKIAAENLAPNNPYTDNVFAPIRQVVQNKTWYDEDLVPKRLQDLPITEQYDEKTDSFSIWLSNKLVQMGMDEENVLSPKQINYLVDQYSGVVGDTVLPFMTPKAESPNDSLIGKIGAPVRDIFTTDSVLNNRVTGDFYETMEAVEAQAASADATEEDKFKRGYLISYNAKVGKLMQEQREIQTSDLPDSEKYAKNRELKEKINALQQEALDTYQNAKVKGKYAEVGDRRYNYSYDSENREYRWYEIQDTNADGTTNYYASQEKDVTKALGISSEKYWNNREMYDDLYYVGFGYDKENIADDSIKTAKHVFGYKEFSEYAGVLKTLKADKDASGNSINGSKKKKVKEYIYSLDIPDIKKHILFKSQYKNDNSHNREIATYIGGATNMSYQQKLDVLSELGFTVDANDYIRW